MSLERNTLMEEVYPKIKEYCKERHGLEFQGLRIAVIKLFLIIEKYLCCQENYCLA